MHVVTPVPGVTNKQRKNLPLEGPLVQSEQIQSRNDRQAFRTVASKTLGKANPDVPHSLDAQGHSESQSPICP